MYKPICTLYWSIQFALFLLGDHFFFDIYFSILILGLGFLQSYFSSNYIFSVEPRIVNISINSSLIFFVFIFTLTANNRKSNAFSKKYGGGGEGSGIKFWAVENSDWWFKFDYHQDGILYLLFNTDIGNFVWKINEGVAGNVFLLIFLFGGAWIVGGWWWRWGRKSYLGLAEITSFSSWDFTGSNKHNTFWHVVPTGYFYISFW